MCSEAHKGTGIITTMIGIIVVFVVVIIVANNIPQTDGKYTLTQYNDDSGNQAMFYTILTPEKDLIIVDGGWSENEEQVRKVVASHGNHVSHWIITHPHPDHAPALTGILNDPKGITIDNIYTVNIPFEPYKAKALPRDQFDSYVEFMAAIKDKQNVHYVNTGDKLNLSGIGMKVYHAYSDYVDEHSDDICNDGSMMFELFFRKETMLFCADVRTLSDYIMKRWGDELKADYIQMAHHGNDGLTEAFYRRVSPKVALFDAPDWLMNGEGYTTPQTVQWMKSIGAKIYSYNTAPNVFEIE